MVTVDSVVTSKDISVVISIAIIISVPRVIQILLVLQDILDYIQGYGLHRLQGPEYCFPGYLVTSLYTYGR